MLDCRIRPEDTEIFYDSVLTSDVTHLVIRVKIDSQNTTSICWFFNLFVKVTLTNK